MKDWLLYAFAVVYPFFAFSVFFSRDTLSLWVAILMLMFVLLELFQSGGRFWFDRSFIYLILFVSVYLITTVIILNQEPGYTHLGRTPLGRAITTDLRLIGVIAAFMVFTNLLADAPEHTMITILKIQIYIGTAVALFGILQYITFSYFGSTLFVGIKPTNESFELRRNIFLLAGKRIFRSSSIFSEPSFFGFFLVPITIKATIAWGHRLYLGPKRMHLGIIIILILAILTNFSFTAVLSLAFLGCLFLVLSLRRAPRTAIGVLSVALLVLGVIVLTPVGTLATERLAGVFQLRDSSTIDRLVRVYTSARVFLDNPWLGVGPGGYAFWYPRMGGLQTNIMASPLNIWLYFLTDVGILGIIPFCCFLVSILRRGIKSFRRHPLVPVYLWSMITYGVLLTTLDFWFLEFIWFELAMLLALCDGCGIRPKSSIAESVPDA